MLTAKGHHKNNFDYQKPIHKDNVKDNVEKAAVVIYVNEKIHDDVTGVTTVAGNIDHETVKDFSFESFIEDLSNYMKMVTGVITVAGNIDSETVNDFGFESFIEDRSNYMKMVTGVITVAGNIDSETVNDFGFESFVEDQSNYMKLVTGAIYRCWKHRQQCAKEKHQRLTTKIRSQSAACQFLEVLTHEVLRGEH